MTKIRPVLLWLLIASPFFGFGHPPESPKPAYLTNEVRTEKQAVFTAHLLTDQVEPEKKYTYELSDRGLSGEPALPDTVPNPSPMAVPDESPGVSVRRRKLHLRGRS